MISVESGIKKQGYDSQAFSQLWLTTAYWLSAIKSVNFIPLYIEYKYRFLCIF